jgi:hypothetical protein
MRTIRLVAAAGLTAAMLSAPVAQAQRRIDPAAAKLPDGDGKIAVIENCAGVCHPSSRFVNLKKSPAEWHKTVMSMVARGAQLFPEDVVTLTNYLGTYLSDSGNPQQIAKPQDAK